MRRGWGSSRCCIPTWCWWTELHQRLLLVLALAATVRLPFWTEALRTPLDGDAAILGLMARNPFESLTLWGQPYGSPVEAWLVAPFVLGLGTTTAAVRLPGFLLGLALVPLAFGIGRALHRDAALLAAVLAACPSSYLLLLSSQPPPLYPTALALGGLLILGALSLGRRLADRAPTSAGLLLWGAAAGLTLWTHLMTASLVVACLVHLGACAPRGARRQLLVAVAAMALATAPLWVFLVAPASAHAVGPRASLAGSPGHALEILPRLHEPLLGLLGAHAPWVADSADPLARTPLWAAAPLVLGQAALFLLACAKLRRRPEARLLVAVCVLTLVAFLFSRRAGPETIRFLTPLHLPLSVLAAWALADMLGTRGRWAAVSLLAALNLTGGASLLAAWRGADRAAAPFHLPDLGALRRLLESRGISRAYASYGPAHRLTYESDESLVVSQFRNERFPGHPLAYLDEVRLASRVAWILTPGIPSDMPGPTAFENDLRAAGGRWERSDAGASVVFHEFVPPFSHTVEPLASAGRAGDGDLATGLTQTGAGGLTLAVDPPRELEAVTLAISLGSGRLPRSFDLGVSRDGANYEIVGRRRWQRALHDLVWAGGQPQYLLEPELMSVPFRRQWVKAIRIEPVGEAQAWELGEVLIHPTGAEGETVLTAPRRLHVDWYYRSLILRGVRS